MACAAASVDGHHVAITRAGELSLYSVEPFVEIARTQLAACTALAFVGRQLLAYDGARVVVYSIQKLAITAQVELPSARLLATSQHYALFARDELVVASCTSEGTTIAPMRTPGTGERAVGLENARFLIWSKKGHAEIWDAASRLPSARVALELPPDTIDVGTTGKHRSVWIATAGGDLMVSRLSDGKTTVAPLPRPPEHITSHPGSAWLVLDFDGEPHAVNSVLRTWRRFDIPAGRGRTLVPATGSHAYVIVDEGDAVARYEIGADAIGKPVRVPIGGPLPDEEPNPVVAPTPVVRVAERKIEVDTLPPRRDSAPVGPSLASRFAGRSAALKPTTASTDWHDALMHWAKRVLGDVPTAELPTGASPVAALADRAQLDTPARRILHVLYADWLAGHGDIGVAAAKLVEIAGPTAWQEALGNGQLGVCRLVTSQVGRCLLARSVGAFLDGRDVEHVRRVDGAGTRAIIAPGTYRTHASHAELARVLGTIGVGDGDAARLEAWLRGWPFVATMPVGEPRPGELVIVFGDLSGLPDLPGV